MLQKYCCLFLIFIFCSSALYAESDEDNNVFSVYGQYSRPSRSYTDDPNIENTLGVGVGYNNIIFSYSPFFSGYRVTGSYQFFLHSMVRPYVGFSYVDGTDIYDKPTKNNIDNVTPVLGVSVKLFHIVEPYVEQSFRNPYTIYGIRLRFDMNYKKK